MPTLPVLPLDDGLDDAFDDENSITATMTGLADSIGKSLSSSGSLAAGAQDAVQASGKALAGAMGGAMLPLFNSKTLGIAGGSLAVIAAVAWVVSNWDSTPAEVAPQEPQAVPTVVESEIVFSQPVVEAQAVIEAEPEVPGYQALLEEARAARDAGNLIEPAGGNAVELYLMVLEEAPEDLAIGAELDTVVSQVLGLAETAILEQSVEDADNALSMVRLAQPDNPRLTFLDAQLTQFQFRATVDETRLAIRDGLLADAGRLISEARTLAGGESAEVNLLSEELSAARSQQQVEEVLAIAGERLEAGSLISPSNDNARYYYELALSDDPGNQAAQQGLTIIASKLALKAREAIDEGRLDDAGDLLRDARALDPSSSELAASGKALDTAYEAIAEAERQAEAARLAELERQAELARQAEAARQEELRKQAELERQAEAARQAELRRQAELERQAEIERLAELERQAEAARLAEIERQAEEARQARLREAAQQAAEQDAAAAATASVLGVAGSTVKEPSGNSVPGLAAAGNNSSRSTQSNNDVAPRPEISPPAASPSTFAAAGGASTFAMGDNGNSLSTDISRATAAPPQILLSGSELAKPVSRGNNNDSAADKVVPISTLTRTNYVAPVYPRAAQRKNTTGSVDVMFTVNAIGTVTDISVLRAEPGETFNQAAMNAVAKWRFEPAIENGVAVEKRTAVRLTFDLR